MLETAGLRDVRFVRESASWDRAVFLFAAVFGSVPGAGQPDVLWVRSKPIDMRPESLRGLSAIETQPDQLRVIGGQAHCVESLTGHLVRRQVVDRVLPQCETRAPLYQQYLDAWLVSGPGFATVVQHHRDPREFQIPAAF